jgi:Protein of unknown function (DUF3455)
MATKTAVVKHARVVLARPVLVALLAACGTSGPKPPDVPQSLKPPAGQVAFLEYLASGVQIYECLPKQGQRGVYEWTFRAPDATLTDWSGRPLGKHYAGPTWEAADGSRVLGEVKARDPGPDPKAIPWLLLAAKSTFGRGVLTQTASIQRVATAGGMAPSEPCSAAEASQFARVPYSATYYFYKAR